MSAFETFKKAIEDAGYRLSRDWSTRRPQSEMVGYRVVATKPGLPQPKAYSVIVEHWPDGGFDAFVPATSSNAIDPVIDAVIQRWPFPRGRRVEDRRPEDEVPDQPKRRRPMSKTVLLSDVELPIVRAALSRHRDNVETAYKYAAYIKDADHADTLMSELKAVNRMIRTIDAA